MEKLTRRMRVRRFSAVDALVLVCLALVMQFTVSNPGGAVAATEPAACPSWVGVVSSPPVSVGAYRVQSCLWVPGGTIVYVTVLDQHGAPISGAVVHQRWPDGNITQITMGGVTQFAMGPSSCDPDAGRPGALSYYVDDIATSEEIKGFCLPLNQHVDFYVTLIFVPAEIGPTATPIAPSPTPGGPTPTPSPTPGGPTPTPTATPAPGQYVTDATFQQFLRDLSAVIAKYEH